jgi:hypothetical protein
MSPQTMTPDSPQTTTPPAVSTLSLRDRVWSPNALADLTVVELSYGHVPSEDVLSGRARPIEARLSADGRAFDSSRWHEGESSDEVYVERITAAGRAFHGYVDAQSRRLVQAG